MHWLISGTASGLGRAVADAALARGDSVTGIMRKADVAAAFEASAPGRALAIVADVSDRAAMFAGVARAEDAQGAIDILVNNAGNVLESYVEEADPDAVRALFEVNLHGPLNLIQAVLPAMRARRRGRILNISSGGGIVGVPWVGLYSASKFALEGMSEALAAEVQALGIAVTIVEPGAFRTSLLLRDHPNAPPGIADYEAGIGKMRARIHGSGGKEPGDPAKFAQAMLTLADAADPPVRIALGDDAIAMALGKADAIRRDVEAWRALGSGLAHDPD
ncbi:SDR family NAD(P)-dependent oxidoreductase [Sphingomonas immobilis]|uniref:SDR family NAD(P)-dependent oxidoreductase n=1 Tax=Sphingomonas immobilis TaxID=3063997 RepID=A0ABT8ZXE2_9SPHN|nr:SDR family NAD(P)-dependent oxidoreductase [Sphingomonas sp. CA1-15]MDO7842214.1 SDR family NAD(P)-dependent oxidoreductase [Sphingomonas sp. CA1-15]